MTWAAVVGRLADPSGKQAVTWAEPAAVAQRDPPRGRLGLVLDRVVLGSMFQNALEAAQELGTAADEVVRLV